MRGEYAPLPTTSAGVDDYDLEIAPVPAVHSDTVDEMEVGSDDEDAYKDIDEASVVVPGENE